ncbi:hypothetical protein Tco_1446959, partial [Tanacetum coccineum]
VVEMGKQLARRHFIHHIFRLQSFLCVHILKLEFSMHDDVVLYIEFSKDIQVFRVSIGVLFWFLPRKPHTLATVSTVASSSITTPTDPPPKDAEWTKIDFIIRSWIFSTLAPSLRKRLVDLNPTTAKDA